MIKTVIKKPINQVRKFGDQAIPVKWAILGFLVFVLSVGINQIQLISVSHSSHDDVIQASGDTFRACNLLIDTRDANIKQWESFYELLYQEYGETENTARLIDEMRAQLIINLPRVSLNECRPPSATP